MPLGLLQAAGVRVNKARAKIQAAADQEGGTVQTPLLKAVRARGLSTIAEEDAGALADVRRTPRLRVSGNNSAGQKGARTLTAGVWSQVPKDLLEAASTRAMKARAKIQAADNQKKDTDQGALLKAVPATEMATTVKEEGADRPADVREVVRALQSVTVVFPSGKKLEVPELVLDRCW